MSQSAHYAVVSHGQVKSGFDANNVAQSFATLFKISPNKATSYISKKHTIKKGIDLKTAKAYRLKLDSIGLEVTVVEINSPSANNERHSAQSEVPKATNLTVNTPPLALIDTQKPSTEGNQDNNQTSARSTSERMVCPKCKLEQSKAEECQRCKVIISRASEAMNQATTKHSTDSKLDYTYANQDNSTEIHKIIIFPMIVAILGAFLWKAIAVGLNIEIAWAAWLIGGAIGFTSAVAGGRGDIMGAICSVLLALSIIGGKYMTAQVFIDELLADTDEISQLLSNNLEGVDSPSTGIDWYDQQVAEFNANVHDERSLRQFMVENDYSDANKASSVTYKEIADFKDDVQPDFEAQIENQALIEETIEELIASSSSLTLIEVLDTFDWIDLLFLLLGGTTAFRVGRGDYNTL